MATCGWRSSFARGGAAEFVTGAGTLVGEAAAVAATASVAGVAATGAAALGEAE